MDQARLRFFEAAENWLCNDYATSVTYIAGNARKPPRLWGASISLNPLPPQQDLSFAIECPTVLAGCIQRYPVNKRELLDLLARAADGCVALPSCELSLPDARLSYYSEMALRDRWFGPLHLRASSDDGEAYSPQELVTVDNELRAASPPFDGLLDLSNYLGIQVPTLAGTQPSITLSVSPPVDLILHESSLRDDHLKLVLHAHPSLDVGSIGLAIRSVPGNPTSARQQISSLIRWDEPSATHRVGIVETAAPDADQAIAMLLLGTTTIRRQWLLDPQKARNHRLLAIQNFDADLRRTRGAIFDSTDSRAFEKGIAALLYLLGFSPVLPLDENAPDVIVATPGGRMAVVECTLRTADVSTKIGKLVDRRTALSRALAASRHPDEVLAVLICRLPRDQIASQDDDLRVHGVVLFTGEDLLGAFDYVRHPGDPDQLYIQALSRLTMDRAEA